MAAKRPRIGVSVSARSGWRVFPVFCWALWRSGGRAVEIAAGRARHTLDGLDGVVIGGGDDIGVELYGGTLLPAATFDKARDTLEMALIREAEERGLPVLGVCRGAQLLNVARGGTLHQDIYAAFPQARRVHTVLPRKRVRIAPGSRLARIEGGAPQIVNALHHQSVDRIGCGLAAVAWDEAGIVQAIEGLDPSRFVLGVQWHPELLVFSRRNVRIFEALVTSARDPSARTEPVPETC